MKWLWSIMLVLILGLQYRLWVGDGSVSHVWHLQNSVDEQRSVNQTLAARNARLDAEVRDLKSGYEAIEERARRNLGMIGRDETFFLVVDSNH